MKNTISFFNIEERNTGDIFGMDFQLKKGVVINFTLMRILMI